MWRHWEKLNVRTMCLRLWKEGIQIYFTPSFEAFTAVKIQVQVFWVVTLCCVVVGYQRFRGSCCLQLHFILKMEATYSSETLVSYNTTQHGVTTQKTWTWKVSQSPHPEDGGRIDFWHVGILPQHYKASQPWGPWRETILHYLDTWVMYGIQHTASLILREELKLSGFVWRTCRVGILQDTGIKYLLKPFLCTGNNNMATARTCIYEGVSKPFRTESITKSTTAINTRWEATQRAMAAKLTRMAHKIAIKLRLVAESCTIAVLAPGGQSGNFWIHPSTVLINLAATADGPLQLGHVNILYGGQTRPRTLHPTTMGR
jgi:hypothetical protein